MAFGETFRAAFKEPLPEEPGACRTTVWFLRAFSWYLVVLASVGVGILAYSLVLMATYGGGQPPAWGDTFVWIAGFSMVAVLVSFLGFGGAFLYWGGAGSCSDGGTRTAVPCRT